MKKLLAAIFILISSVLAQEEKALAVLKSEAPLKEKIDACRQLARIGTGQSVPILASLLADESLSHMARYALEQIPDPSVNSALRDCLTKVKGRSLIGIIHTLGVRKATEAVDQLSALISDPDPAVSEEAARALGNIGRPALSVLEKAVFTDPPQQKPAFYEALFRCVDQLPAPEAATLYERVWHISQVPGPFHLAALKGIVRCRGNDALPLLIQALKTEKQVSAADAIAILAELPGQEVTKALVDEITHATPQTQILLIQALGRRRDKTAATSLPALAQEGPVDRRVAAIRSCAQLGDPTSIPLLFELAKDRETAVSSAALAALTGVPVAEADTALLALLLELTDNRRIAVIDAISQRRVLAAVPSLLKCAADPDAGVANAAFQALGELAEARAIPSIIDALNQTKALSAGENALTAICARQTDRSQCAKLLAEGFTKTSGEAKLAVLRVLGTVGGETALDAVRAATREPDKEVKETALRVLCDWPTPEALPDLAELTKTTPDQKFRILALRAQLRLIPAQTSSDESKIAQLKEIIPMLERPEEKRLALAALVNIPTAEALALVVPHFDSEGVKEEAADAAVSIAEKIVKNNPAKVAEVINLVRTNNKKLLERTRALRETAVATLQQQGFVPIFNGKDMQGWDGKPGWWQVEDSALTSESTPDKPCPKANYLIWRGGRPSNFELLIDFKLSSEGNSGIQIRSEERPDWDTFGYQADMTGNGDLIGYIYHHSRGLVAGRGEKVTFGPDGSRSVDRFANPDELLKRFRPGEWNTYRIVCNGTDISVYLNGTLMCHVTDRSPQAPAQGIIALQMHPGPPMKVQFKNILLRELR